MTEDELQVLLDFIQNKEVSELEIRAIELHLKDSIRQLRRRKRRMDSDALDV